MLARRLQAGFERHRAAARCSSSHLAITAGGGGFFEASMGAHHLQAAERHRDVEATGAALRPPSRLPAGSAGAAAVQACYAPSQPSDCRSRSGGFGRRPMPERLAVSSREASRRGLRAGNCSRDARSEESSSSARSRGTSRRIEDGVRLPIWWRQRPPKRCMSPRGIRRSVKPAADPSTSPTPSPKRSCRVDSRRHRRQHQEAEPESPAPRVSRRSSASKQQLEVARQWLEDSDSSAIGVPTRRPYSARTLSAYRAESSATYG